MSLTRSCLSVVTTIVCGASVVTAQDSDYPTIIRPLLARYCDECHSKDVTEADVDLGVFTNVADVRRQTKVWLKVREMLDSGQMPPKESEQPTDAERTQLRKWVRDFLANEAKAHAGDPGPIVLRRLSNAEYNYAIRDLTGVADLDPTREFPVDGAAGEGFTNVGSGQGMSPALIQKYLDAGKEVAEHLVLLPDGVRFSPVTTRRDQTDELLARIQSFYRRFTADGGGTAVNLQGIQFETNQGGLLPVEKYLLATLEERDALTSGQKTIDDVARERSLNVRYLQTLWSALTTDSGGLLLDAFRERWRQSQPKDLATLQAEISAAQNALWKFNSIGQYGRDGGPKSWLEGVTPITSNQELRLPLANAVQGENVVIHLVARNLNDEGHPEVVWKNARIEFPADAPGGAHPPILLRDIRQLSGRALRAITAESIRTRRYLEAVDELRQASEPVEDVARARELNPQLLTAWMVLTGFSNSASREITGHFRDKVERVSGYDAVNGWGRHETPVLLTNRSAEPITFLTLTVPARGVTVHPSPTLEGVVAWRSPLTGKLQLSGLVADADDKCGNGAAWNVELRSATGTKSIASGVFNNGGAGRWTSEQTISVETGDVVQLTVNARDSNHACDTTHVELTLTEVDGEGRVWDLAKDVVDNILASNPLPDSYGNPQTWHFCEAGNTPNGQPVIPTESTLNRWRTAVLESKPADEVANLAAAVEKLMTDPKVDGLSEADKALRSLLLDWKGPLHWVAASAMTAGSDDDRFGLDPAQFGKLPDGAALEPADLALSAPQILDVRLPAALVAGGTFVANCVLDQSSDKDRAVQVQVLPEKPASLAALTSLPVLVGEDAKVRNRVEASMQEFRELIPPALCYARIVPVDEVVTLTLFYREDDQLRRLMLNDAEAAELDRLWDELLFVSQEPLKLVVAYEQIVEFATQDRPDLVTAFASLKDPINKRAEAFRQRLDACVPDHVDGVLEFAARAWRRPLSAAEQQGLRNLYEQLRQNELPHEDSIRLTLARVLTAPAFLYKLEQPSAAEKAVPVSGLELASRLSFFLWSSVPDAELVEVAQRGELHRDEQLLAQTRRMLKNPRTERLAIQFACQWLHLRDFDKHNDKNERLYPQFAALSGDMYRETVLFFDDLFRNDGSILDILDADNTFLSEPLAAHYGIPWAGVRKPSSATTQDGWRRFDGVRAAGRGGILGMATFLSSQSGASRTSPILRGNWVYETLLGERLPRPPAGVPQLPETLPSGLTERELIEQHSSVAACAKCHAHIDPYGFALEQFDAIGRLRAQPVDTRTTLIGGKSIEGIAGLRDYLLQDRRDDFVRQFCRKLLGYALGREVQLSDEPLLDDLQTTLTANDYRFPLAVERIVTSPQFRNIRGAEQTDD